MKIPKAHLHSLEARIIHTFGGICERGSWQQCRYLGAWLGMLFHGALPTRRKISQRNLLLAFPHLTAQQANHLACRASQNAAMTLCEFLHLKAATASELRDYSSIIGLEYLQQASSRGKGTILLTAHLGNWEVMGARAALEMPLSVIARPRSNPAVQAHIESIRTQHNIRVLSRFDTGREPIRILQANESLGILPDQYEKEGVILPFFRQPTRVNTALARLAMISGATVVPAFGVRREPWLSNGQIVAQVSQGFEIDKGKDRHISALEGTQRVLSELETIMRAYPGQWLWMHHRWRHSDGVSPSFKLPEKKMYEERPPTKI